MVTNVELDDALVKKAMKVTNFSTEKELLNTALEELIHSINIRREMLKYMDSDICWEGYSEDLRAMR